jgi:hypothetical protein
LIFTFAASITISFLIYHPIGPLACTELYSYV